MSIHCIDIALSIDYYEIMKDSQLQIRISSAQKIAIQRAARNEGKDVSTWVLEHCLNHNSSRFQSLIVELRQSKDPSFILAELNDFLTRLSPRDFPEAVKYAPEEHLGEEDANRVAAMVEQAAIVKRTESPAWTSMIPPLANPVFDTELQSLRLHLLLNAPAAFKKRNIFVDSSIGARV